MGWETLIPLMVTYGVPFAQSVWEKASKGTPPTAADWEALNKLALQNRQTQMSDALARNGIDPNSEKGKALLALVK